LWQNFLLKFPNKKVGPNFKTVPNFEFSIYEGTVGNLKFGLDIIFCPPNTTTLTLARKFVVMEMSASVLRDIIKQNDLYTIAALNNMLDLHFKGFFAIQNLLAFTGMCFHVESRSVE